MKSIFFACFVIFLTLSGLWGFSYVGVFDAPQIEPGELVVVKRPNVPSSTVVDYRTLPTFVPYDIEEVATDFVVPWDMVFLTDRLALVSERGGRISQLDIETGEKTELYAYDVVSDSSEEGLMGMALDPNFKETGKVFVCVALPQPDGGIQNEIQTFVYTQGALTDLRAVFSGIPAAKYHAGCRIAFGPDGMLYVTTGDATDKTLPQDLGSLGGKILRMTPEGHIPPGNPFPESFIYSYGHRNSQGIAWFPDSGAMVSTEHGPSIFDGPAGGDEINCIEPGRNYGWPIVSHEQSERTMRDPKYIFTPAVAPGSALVYSGDVFPQWKHSLIFGALRGEGVYVVRFVGDGCDDVETVEQLMVDVGRVRTVVEGPDGYIYFTTSNQDSRGEPSGGDDRVMRIVPRK